MTSSKRSAADTIRCELAVSEQHMRDVTIVRGIAFIEEGAHDADFIFDANDRCATHFVFYDRKQPVGALRIRFFAGFAKYERTCFRPGHRNPFVVKHCVEMTFPHVARKGYTRVVTQSDARLAQLWTRLFGFECVDRHPVLIQGHPPYVTVVGTIAADPHAVRYDGEGEALLQAENAWLRKMAETAS